MAFIRSISTQEKIAINPMSKDENNEIFDSTTEI